MPRVDYYAVLLVASLLASPGCSRELAAPVPANGGAPGAPQRPSSKLDGGQRPTGPASSARRLQASAEADTGRAAASTSTSLEAPVAPEESRPRPAAAAAAAAPLERPRRRYPTGGIRVVPPVLSPDLGAVVGWSADSTELACCSTGAGDGVTGCSIRDLDGHERWLSDYPPDGGEPTSAQTRSLERLLARRGYGAVGQQWPHAEVVDVVWKVVQGEQQVPRLLVGLAPRGEQPTRWALRIAAPPPYEEISPDSISLAPNGKWLGVVSRAWVAPHAEHCECRLLELRTEASRALNRAGLRWHKRKAHRRAAGLFAKAAEVNPEHPFARYNQACALARMHDPGAQGALRQALERAADQLKLRARGDADFASVREEPWFLELLH